MEYIQRIPSSQNASILFYFMLQRVDFGIDVKTFTCPLENMHINYECDQAEAQLLWWVRQLK